MQPQNVIVLALLLDLLAFTLILPLLPRILAYYDATEHPQSLYFATKNILNSYKMLVGFPANHRLDIVLFGGLVGSLFSLLQFLVSPIIGRLSDHHGRRNVLLLSMLGNAVSMALWVAGGAGFVVFVWSRIVGGLTEGILSSLSSVLICV